MSWVDYWSDTRFDGAFWRRSLEHYVAGLHAQVPFAAHERVLDYGSGPGFLAPALHARVASVCLAERAGVLCEHARRLTADLDRVSIVHLASTSGPEVLPAGAFDVVIVNSVLQYVSRAEAPALLEGLGHRLAPGGRIVASDLVPPGNTLVPELVQVARWYRRWFGMLPLLRYLAWEAGKLPARRRLSLTRYDRASFEDVVPPHFSVDWIENPTVCSGRRAAVLRLR